MKAWIRKIHLWIGLPLGGLFFIISISGALYCWAPEIAAIKYKERVVPQENSFVAVSILRDTLKEALPKGDFRTVYYKGSSHAIQVLLYAPGTYYYASMNPYTGELIHLQDMKKGWLNQLKFLHRNLLMGEIGREIVHWGTLLYLLMVLSGIVLWWPVNRAFLKRRFRINLRAPWKVFNYEFHNVMGFYASWILLFVIITGLFWGFNAVENSFGKLSGEDVISYDTPLSNDTKIKEHSDPFELMEQLAIGFRKKYPNKNIRVHNPHKSNDPIHVAVIESGQLAAKVDHLYFDRYTGEKLKGHFKYGLHQGASFFNRLHTWVYDIHFGSILGLTGRILVFVASLIGATLPITGFLIWWNKRRIKGI